MSAVTAIPKRPLYVWLTHPFEVCLALALVLTAIPSLAQDWTFSGVIDERLGWVLSLIWQGGLILGGTMSLWGLFRRPRAASRKDSAYRLAKLRAIEGSGSVLMGTSCAVYAFVLGAFADKNLFVVSAIATLAMAFFLRSIALRMADSIVLNTLRDFNATVA